MKRSRRALLTITALVAVLWCASRVAISSGNLIDRQRFTPPNDAFVVTDRHGVALRLARVDGVDRRWVRLSEVSPTLVRAVLAAEDARFYEHDGVDRRAIGRAIIRNVLPGGTFSGASTITQQLIKRVYGRNSGAFSKGLEILRAQSLERVMSKDEILEQYLNRIPYGDNIEGVARACESYFGHGVGAVTVAEAALLAAIPRAPTATEPRRHVAAAKMRRDDVLHRMHARGWIDARSYESARAEPITVIGTAPRPWHAPSFVDRALVGLRAGALTRESPSTLRTSLDLATQSRAEQLLHAQLATVSNRGARNAAAVVIANSTGEILAYVGASERDSEGGGLDLLDAERQPGSSLKPFAYELFFERGGTAATVLDDVAWQMTGADGAQFEARDYDRTERGPVRARVALSASLNLAALDLSRRVGADALTARLRLLGFSSVHGSREHGAAVVLGGVGVTGLQLADAYVTLARYGTRAPIVLAPVTAAVAGTRVMSASAARVAWDILSDPAARREGFGDDLSALSPGVSFALKTGTSSNWRDAWCAVSTDRVTVLVWVGDPSGRAMAEVTGFRGAAPAAVRIAHAAHVRATELAIAVPPRAAVTLVDAEVCPWTGLRPGPRCAHTVHERFAQGTIPSRTCEAHNARGDFLASGRLTRWAERSGVAGVAMAAATGSLSLREPRDGARWIIDSARGQTSVTLRASRGGVEVPARFELDGQPLPSSRWELTAGAHTLVAIDGAERSPAVHVSVSSRGGPPRI